MPWNHLNLTELDVSCCYKMDDQFLNTLLSATAPKLRYLRCAVDNEIIQNISEVNKPLRTLDLRRIEEIDIKEMTKFLSSCECLEALDVSSIPMDYEDFKSLLPNLPRLRWLSIAGNDVGKQTFDIISQHNQHLKELSINFYQSSVEDVDLLRNLISSCQDLQKICLQCANVKSVTSDIQKSFGNGRFVDFCKSSEFLFPSPQWSIKTFSERFARQSAGLSDFSARDERTGEKLAF